MIEIEEPPTTRACSACYEPLEWVWRHSDRRWYAVVRYRDVPDPTVVKLHTCPLPNVPKHPYRLEYQPREVWDRGRRKARAVLAAKAKKLTEERTTP